VLQRKLGDFAVDYEINVFTDDPTRCSRLLEPHRNILDGSTSTDPDHDVVYEGDPATEDRAARSRFAALAELTSSERVVETAVPAGPADVGLAMRRDLETPRKS
jgi:hypothetical protein